MNECLEFAFFFGFLVIWTIAAYKGVTSPEWLLHTRWGRSVWRGASSKQVRWVSVVFLAAGIAFLVFALWQLSQGTFTWRGYPRAYGFSDFFR